MLHGCDQKDTYSMAVYTNVTYMRMPIRNSVQLTDNCQTIVLRAQFSTGGKNLLNTIS